MLITLQSNSADDAADFSNYFKETILIQPMSELALVNLCYKFEAGITVEEGSNTYEIGMGTMPGLFTLAVAPGSYSIDNFLVALNSSLSTHVNSLSYWQQKAFPVTKQTWAHTDGTKSILELTLEYSPTDWQEFKVLKGADDSDTSQIMKLIALTDAAMMDTTSKGNVENVTLVDGYTSQFNGGFGTNDSDATRTNLWGTAKGNDDGSPYGHIKWSPQQTAATFTIGCADSGLPDWTDLNSLKFCIDVRADGNYVVKEKDQAGVLTAISFDAPYESHKSFEIRVFQGVDKEIEYYYDGNIVAINDGVYRQKTKPGDNLVPAGAFETKKIVSEIIATLPDGAFSQANSWKVASVATAGSGYQVGDICTATSLSGEVATIRISSILTGGVNGVEVIKNPGGLGGAGETLAVVSPRTSASGCTVTFDPVPSCTLTAAGEGYTTSGLCDIEIGATVIKDAFTAITTGGGPSGIRLLDVGNSGKVLTVTITDGGTGYAVGDTGTITPDASSPAFAQQAIFTVAGETGGAVNSITITDGGLYYTPDDPCVLTNGGASPGSGSGCEVDILTVEEDATGQTYTVGPVELKKDGQVTGYADMTITNVNAGGSVGTLNSGTSPGAGFVVGDFVEIFQPTVASGTPSLPDRAFAKVTGITGQLTDGGTWAKLLTNAVGLNAVGDTVCNVIQGGLDLGGIITISAVNATRPSVTDLQYDTILQKETDTPLGVHGDAEFVPSAGFLALTGVPEGSTDLAKPPLVLTATTTMTPARQSCQILVNVDQFQLKSMCKEGGVQKAIAAVPMGATAPTSTPTAQIGGEFYWEPYNMLYHDLENKSVDNHNQLRVRLTDALGNPLKDLIHPTTLTLDLRPRAK